ncbi:ROK family protein [Pendulispora rubella]|uniref:ROK family protein n=1 Tax=Pendulispora rubella TaxID=2741070 RepID=A0ABZ2L9P9_9BACT
MKVVHSPSPVSKEASVTQVSEVRVPQVGTPASMRELNQRIVLTRLRSGGAATRPQLAKDTGLSKPTVGQALLELEQSRLVRTIGRTSAGLGRSAILYESNPSAGHVMGIDIGRARIRVAVADLAGTVVARLDEPNRCATARALVKTVNQLAHKTVRDAGLDLEDMVAKVVGSPGVPDPRGRILHYAPNLPDWGKKGLLDELEAALGVGLVVENDANLAAVGEHARGAAKGVSSFVCVVIGTGIGMGIVLEGRLYRGAHGAAGEVGYLPYGWNGDENGAAVKKTPSARGLMEAAAAGDSVLKMAKSENLRDAQSALDVFVMARNGDARARRIVTEEAARLAYLVASVSAVLDPELVVLSGGIGKSADLLAGPMDKALRGLTPLVPRIVASELGEDAVLTGAISIGLRSAEDIVFDRRNDAIAD